MYAFELVGFISTWATRLKQSSGKSVEFDFGMSDMEDSRQAGNVLEGGKLCPEKE